MSAGPRKPHCTETPEYWEGLARDERSFAQDRTGTVESQLLHKRNAEEYERKAVEIRAKLAGCPREDARRLGRCYSCAVNACIASGARMSLAVIEAAPPVAPIGARRLCRDCIERARALVTGGAR